MTIHKSQGGTYDYFELNLDRTCKTPNYKAPVQRGLVYTGLSRGQNSDHINLTNFDENCIKVNKNAKKEMERMRIHCVFTWEDP